MFHTPLQLKLCPLPNIPPKKITSAPGFKEFIVTVTDRSGRPIDGLKESDFSLSIDGRPVPINYFRTSDGNLPTAIAIVVDSSGSMKDKLSLDSGGKFDTVREKLSAAAPRFRACDELAVFTFGGSLDSNFFFGMNKVQIAEPFTSDYQSAIASLSQVEPYGQTPLYDSMLSAIAGLSFSNYLNRTLLVITDGMDNMSKAKLRDVTYEALRHNVTIYAVGIGNSAAKNPLGLQSIRAMLGVKPDSWVDVEALTKMTTETGGRLWIVKPAHADSDQKMETALMDFTNSIGHGYSIGIVDAENKPIRITVKGHAGAVIHARPSGII